MQHGKKNRGKRKEEKRKEKERKERERKEKRRKRSDEKPTHQQNAAKDKKICQSYIFNIEVQCFVCGCMHKYPLEPVDTTL